ncbi:MAG: hypothetical protein R3F23_02075 [Verrucomicrobiia bacterium]
MGEDLLFRGEVGCCVIGAPDFWSDEVIELSDDLPQMVQRCKQPLDHEQIDVFLSETKGVNGELLFGTPVGGGNVYSRKISRLIFLSLVKSSKIRLIFLLKRWVCRF